MDKYTKVKAIGKGNMGTCTLARNNEDGQCYVIKQVDLTRLSKKDRQQSLNEARVLSSLRHPNIINYVDSFLARKSDSLCIVMEFADGGDLCSRLKKNYGVNLPERQVLDWLIQLVLSLQYIHQRKILHRDVKTQNIFLTNESVIKLGDFGIARTLASTYDQAQTFVGTPYYLSPELILEKPYDHRSDVWALGVVLYEVMSLDHPFNAKDMKGLLQCILAVQYTPLPTVYSAALRDIVARMLVRNPADRIELGDVLRLPIVHQRMRQWLLEPDCVPAHYVRSLCRHGLLPADGVGAAVSGPPQLTAGGAAAAAAVAASAAAAAAAPAEKRKLSASTSGHLDPHTPLPAMRGGRHVVASMASQRSPAAAAADPPDCVRPHLAPPQKSTSPPPPPLMSSSSPSAYPRQLPAVHYHLQSAVAPLAPPQPPANPHAAPSTTASSYMGPLPSRKRSEVSRQPSISPPPSHLSSGRIRKPPRPLARPYVAQLHVTPGAYPGDRGRGGGAAASPPTHLLLANPRKHISESRRAYPAARPPPVFLNPLYRPQNGNAGGVVAPPYSQLAPIPAPSSDIKAMLHRAAVDRARRRQGLN